MRHEPGHAIIGQAARVVAGTPTDELPPELEILARLGLSRPPLRVAARAAHEQRVGAARWLIANGYMKAETYYAALARFVGSRLLLHDATVARGTSPVDAYRAGGVRLADTEPARWLLAPQDACLRAFANMPIRDPAAMAMTTPAHLATLLRDQSQGAIEALARDALPAEAPRLSARGAVDGGTKTVAAGLALIGLLGCLCAPRLVGDLLSLVFFCGIVFRLWLASESLAARDTARDPPPLPDAALPTYSVLVPLRDEAALVPKLLAALAALDYPRAKLEVLVLVEPEDAATRHALAAASLPPWLQVVVGPHGGALRTKPRALNIGLAMARGRLVVVYDAEDRPDPDQLRKAAAAFAMAPPALACLQARLAIDPHPNWLTRLFALEYAALFDVLNVGTANARLPLALGGTSNHFKAEALKRAGGWDAWNVTEDADLGLRLARLGCGVACLASTTRETAPEHVGVWMKQRRRWTKGWMQTLVVLAKDAPNVARQLGGRRSAALILTLVNLVIGPLLFPLFVALLIHDLATVGAPAPHGWPQIAEATLAMCVLILGTGATLWSGWLGMRARGLWRLSGYLPLLVPYQLLIGVAAWWGLVDLVRRPHHWHKTDHRDAEAITRSSRGARLPLRTARRRS